MAEDPKITEYTLCQVRIAGFDSFRCDGIKVTEESETEMEYDGSSQVAFSRTRKKQKGEFELVKPRDSGVLHEAYRLCKEENQTFPMVILAQNKNGEWKVMERLDDCDIPGIQREIGSHSAIQLSVKGTFLGREVKQTEFA